MTEDTAPDAALRERPSVDMELIHRLVRELMPVAASVMAGGEPEDAAQRLALADLRLLLEELHPADVADILESLPQEERMLVWHRGDAGRRRRSLAGSFGRGARKPD